MNKLVYAVCTEDEEMLFALFKSYGWAADFAEPHGLKVVNITHRKNRHLIEKWNLETING